ncbi:hypothetical protein GGR57DRAFT_513946 [Xylariaceae sp. FL1272]|nr:hypothetical protein GGR57DRAFT_513946 [Xylariaceae sp. FL1272]
MLCTQLSILLLLLLGAQAHISRLIVGTFSTKFLYTVEYDDEQETISLIGNTSVPYAANWIALDHSKSNLYTTAYGQSNVAQTPMFVSYSLTNATSIIHRATIPAGGDCDATSIFIVADRHPPFRVYGTYFASVPGINAGCGTVFSVDESGTLAEVVQNYTYTTNISGVHGTVLSPDSRFLYSADDTGNTLWTHSIDRDTGEVSYVANLTGPSPGSDPRHVAIHPGGKYLYVILEGTSQLAQYTIDRHGLPHFDEVYPLLYATQSTAAFWADEVALSANAKYLWASNRARDPDTPGLISAFTLARSGRIVKQNFLLPTSTSGGIANILTPSPWDDGLVALTSNDTGSVEMWRMSRDGREARSVARLEVEDGGGCCGNAVWVE